MRGNYSLTRSVLSGSASAGPMDNTNTDKIKYRTGGVFSEGDDVSDVYDATGNLRVARTLSNYRKARAQQGIQGQVYGQRNEQGRVYRDADDEALQGRLEGTGSDFQLALAAAEKANAGNGPSQFTFDMKDGRGPQPYAIGAGGGAGAGGAGAGAGGAGNAGPTIGTGWTDDDIGANADTPQDGGIWIDDVEDPAEEIADVAPKSGGYNWWDANKKGLGNAFGDVVEGYGNIWPHLANIKDYKEMDGVTAPMLQRGVPLERPSLESYKQAIIAQGRNAQNQAVYDTAQSGQQAGQRAQFLAQTQGQLSKLAGYEGNLKADIANKERMVNAKIDQNNLQSVNQYYDDITERSLYQTQGIANERNQIASNILGFVGGQRQRSLDQEKMQLSRQKNDIENSMNRASYDFFKKTGTWPSMATAEDRKTYLS